MNRKSLTLVVLLVFAPALLYAGSACNLPTIVPSDGRVVDFDFVAASPGANFYQFSVTAGNSYSVEVRQPYDDSNTDLTVTSFTDANTCGTALTGTTSTTTADPALPANATRFSFTAAASGTVTLKVANGNVATGRYVSVSVSDTTQYNVRWSTFGTFITQWGFQNTTSSPIIATLTTTTVLGGSGTNSITFTVPANTQVFKIIGASGVDINVGGNKAGFAVLSNNGPAGGLLTDAFFINGSATVIVPSVFQPVRQGHASR